MSDYTVTDDDWKAILTFVPSSEQHAAITAPVEPARIIAGAGTGKTAVMAARIAWLVLTEQVAPEKVLGLTFTTKATAELDVRVRKYLAEAYKVMGVNPSTMGEPTISTYNSFGSRILREHALRIGMEPDSRIVVDAVRFQLAHRVVASTAVDIIGAGYTASRAVEDLVSFDETLAGYLIDPSKVRDQEMAHLAQYEQSEDGWNDLPKVIAVTRKRIALCDLVAEFRQAKLDHDIIDYSDQVRLAAHAAINLPSIGEELRSSYDTVLLDEYQDTSRSQMLMLKAIFGNGFPLMAVGDPCQAIYRWRGAEIANIDNFDMDFAYMRNGEVVRPAQFTLQVNRRSAPEIIDVANDISQRVREIHKQGPLIAGRPDLSPGHVAASAYTHFYEEVDALAQTVATLDCPLSDVAILVRVKANISEYVSALEARGIPVQVADAGSLLEMPEVREAVAYLQVIADPTANPSLARILAGPRWRIGARDLAILGRHAVALAKRRGDDELLQIDAALEDVVGRNDRAEFVSLLDALELADDPTYAYSPEARERMLALSVELRELRTHVGEPVADLLGRVLRTTGLGIEAMVKGGGAADRLAILGDLISGFRDLDGQMSLQAFLSYVADADRYSAAISGELPRIPGAVTIMTIHKAKGLEYPVVVLPDWTKGTFPTGKPPAYFTGTATVLPSEYIESVSSDDDMRAFPGAHVDYKKAYARYIEAMKRAQSEDEERLAYVAVTRAEKVLVASSAWWGPSQKKPRGPGDYLKKMHEHVTVESPWQPEPAEASNPSLEEVVYPTWPPALDSEIIAALREQDQLLRTVSTADASEPDISAEWDRDIEAVMRTLAMYESTQRTVTLPTTLTASQLLALKADEQEFLSNLVRPMPRQPSYAADRGTAFHAWVEVFYGKRGLFEPDDLPGAVDDPIYSDADLAVMRERFEAGPFAQRDPLHIEQPFALVVNGRTLRGRIDAVFSGSVTDPSASATWLVVDWKTGAPGSADDLQLSIYRHAWAQIAGVDPEQVHAAFYYVGHGVTSPLESPLSLEQLSELLS